MTDHQHPTAKPEGEGAPVEQRAYDLLVAGIEGFDTLSAGKKTDIHRVLVAALSASPPVPAVAWPEKWSGDCTVGNFIANLSSLPPEMPLYTAYHIPQEDARSLLKVKRPTLSRERVDGSNIKTGDETIPYSAVIWSQPKETPYATPSADQSGVIGALVKALEPFAHIASHAGLPNDDTVHLTSLNGQWIATIEREDFWRARRALAAHAASIGGKS